jgi:hypothetical protein
VRIVQDLIGEVSGQNCAKFSLHSALLKRESHANTQKQDDDHHNCTNGDFGTPTALHTHLDHSGRGIVPIKAAF